MQTFKHDFWLFTFWEAEKCVFKFRYLRTEVCTEKRSKRGYFWTRRGSNLLICCLSNFDRLSLHSKIGWSMEISQDEEGRIKNLPSMRTSDICIHNSKVSRWWVKKFLFVEIQIWYKQTNKHKAIRPWGKNTKKWFDGYFCIRKCWFFSDRTKIIVLNFMLFLW